MAAEMKSPLVVSPSGKLRLSVKVKPKSSPEGIAGVHDGHLVIRLSAPAVDGRANYALVSYLAKLLRIKRTDVLLVTGEKSRSKLLVLVGVTPSVSAVSLRLHDVKE